MNYVAAIDIGSNALRLAIANISQGSMTTELRRREPVRLGQDAFSKGHIQKKTLTELSEAVQRFKNQMDNFKVHCYRAVATSALREVKNQKEVSDFILQNTGVPIEIISGEEEARLVALAISHKTSLEKQPHLIIDIGGGSVELIAHSKGKILRKASFPLGTLRLLALFREEKKKTLRSWIAPLIKQHLGDFFKDIPQFPVAVGTGGNMDRFAKMASMNDDFPEKCLTRSTLESLSHQLCEMKENERIAHFQLRRDRADVIIPAILTTLEIMNLAHSKELHLPQVGLKEGILYELAESS